MIIKQRLKAGEIDRMDLVGSVKDCDCILGMCVWKSANIVILFVPMLFLETVDMVILTWY